MPLSLSFLWSHVFTIWCYFSFSSFYSVVANIRPYLSLFWHLDVWSASFVVLMNGFVIFSLACYYTLLFVIFITLEATAFMLNRKEKWDWWTLIARVAVVIWGAPQQWYWAGTSPLAFYIAGVLLLSPLCPAFSSELYFQSSTLNMHACKKDCCFCDRPAWVLPDLSGVYVTSSHPNWASNAIISTETLHHASPRLSPHNRHVPHTHTCTWRNLCPHGDSLSYSHTFHFV